MSTIVHALDMSEPISQPNEDSVMDYLQRPDTIPHCVLELDVLDVVVSCYDRASSSRKLPSVWGIDNT